MLPLLFVKLLMKWESGDDVQVYSTVTEFTGEPK